MNPELVVIIPVYNEETIISTVIKDWQHHLDNLKIDYSIKLYNDGSKDNSAQIIEKMRKGSKRVDLINKENSGHGPTILEGYRNNLNAKWIFQVDSDNEMQAKHFESLWKHRDQYDFLIGRRINRTNTLVRSIMTMISRNVIRLYYGKGVTDVNCPYRLMRTTTFAEIIHSIPEDTFAPNLIISGMSVKSKMRVKQVDIEFVLRETGESTLNSNVIKLLKIAVRSFQETIRFAKNN